VDSHRPLAALIRGAKDAESFFFFLSAERAERKKQHPFGKFSFLEFIGVRIYNLGWQLLTRRRQIVFHLPLLASRVNGASQRQMKIIVISAISAALGKRAVNALNLFRIDRYKENATYSVLALISHNI
jgi:hypothetical protein